MRAGLRRTIKIIRNNFIKIRYDFLCLKRDMEEDRRGNSYERFRERFVSLNKEMRQTEGHLEFLVNIYSEEQDEDPDYEGSADDEPDLIYSIKEIIADEKNRIDIEKADEEQKDLEREEYEKSTR